MTLIEVMIALTLASVAVILAHAVVTVVHGGIDALTRSVTAHEDEQRWHAQLRETFDLISTAGPQAGFRGDSLSCAFSTVATSAELGMIQQWHVEGSGTSLQLRGENGGLGFRSEGFAEIRLEYLEARGASQRWLQRWESAVSVPVAIRIRLRRSSGVDAVDTLLLSTGTRG